MRVATRRGRADRGCMNNIDRTFSPQRFARLAGLLYFVIIIGGIFAELFVRQGLIVPHDAAATAANIIANEQMYRWGFVAQLVPLLCNMFLAVLMFELFSVVSRRVAWSVVFCSLVGSAVEAADLLNHFQPLILLERGLVLGVDRELLEAQAYMALSLQSVGFAVALTFFGCVCIARGWLIYHSGFMPRFIGVFLAIEGVCYLVNSFGNFLAPALAGRLFSVLLITGLAEVVLCLWLLVRGVNVAKWNDGRRPAKPIAENGY